MNLMVCLLKSEFFLNSNIFSLFFINFKVLTLLDLWLSCFFSCWRDRSRNYPLSHFNGKSLPSILCYISAKNLSFDPCVGFNASKCTHWQGRGTTERCVAVRFSVSLPTEDWVALGYLRNALLVITRQTYLGIKVNLKTRQF